MDEQPTRYDIKKIIYLFMSYCIVNDKINKNLDPEEYADYILARWNEEIIC